jgi:phage-related protein
MSQQITEKLADAKQVEKHAQAAKYGDKWVAHEAKKKEKELIQDVQRFVGWAIFSLRKKLENEIGENEEQIELLDSMAVFHHEVVDDDEYMQLYYATVDQLTNKGGWSLSCLSCCKGIHSIWQKSHEKCS